MPFLVKDLYHYLLWQIFQNCKYVYPKQSLLKFLLFRNWQKFLFFFENQKVLPSLCPSWSCAMIQDPKFVVFIIRMFFKIEKNLWYVGLLNVKKGEGVTHNNFRFIDEKKCHQFSFGFSLFGLLTFHYAPSCHQRFFQ